MKNFVCDSCGREIRRWDGVAVLRDEQDTWFSVTHAGGCTLSMLDHLAAGHDLRLAT